MESRADHIQPDMIGWYHVLYFLRCWVRKGFDSCSDFQSHSISSDIWLFGRSHTISY